VNFNWRQCQFFSDLGVFDRLSLIEKFAFYPFVHQLTPDYGRTAAVCLDGGVFNDTFIVDFDLKLHHVTTGRCIYHAATNGGILVIEGTHVARILIKIDCFFAVSYDFDP